MPSKMNVSPDPIIPNTASGDRLLKAAEAASLLGCSTRTIWTLRSRGALPAVAIGAARRFRMSDVQRLIREGAPS